MLKFTVILVRRSTSTAPSNGFVDTTIGRGFIDAAAVVDRPAHTMITNAAIAILMTVDLRTLAPVALPNVKTPDSTNARSMPVGDF